MLGLFCVLLHESALLEGRSIQPLTESTVVEVINEVSILSGEGLQATPAELNARFKAPDFLQTGRRSRARLEADDGTITRIGSNTLFSFDEKNRSINLKRGSLLFHSPEGRGGGRVVTASATASVVGTTIIVAATTNGGFKLLVLEGTAQVAYPDGSIHLLQAGQMTFVLPEQASGGAAPKATKTAKTSKTSTVADTAEAGTGAGAASGASETSSSEAPRGAQPGPVLNFDLGRMQKGSSLINGFAEPIASEGLIFEATQKQDLQKESGGLEATDALIITAEDAETVVLQVSDSELATSSRSAEQHTKSEESDKSDGADTSDTSSGTSGDGSATNPTPPRDPELERFIAATATTVAPQTDGFSADHFFDAPGVVVPADTIPSQTDTASTAEDDPLVGFVAGNILFDGGTLDLSPIVVESWLGFDGFYFIGAANALHFSGDNVFTGFSEFSDQDHLEFSTLGSLNVAPESNLSIQALPSSNVQWQLFGHDAVDLSGVSLDNSYGSIAARSELSDLTIQGASQLSARVIEASSGGELSVHASTLISTGTVRLSAESALNVAANAFLLGQKVELLSYGDLAVDSSSMTASTFSATSDFGPLFAEANGTITLSGYTNLSGRSIDIKSETNSVEVSGGSVTLDAADRVELHASQLVRVDAASISANFIRLHADEIRSNAAAYTGNDLMMEGGTLIDLQQIDLSGLNSVNLAARTLVLADVRFNKFGQIHLQSELGQLAPNPNSGASALAGHVNFIQNVEVWDSTNSYGTPAEYFVHTSQGGLDYSANASDSLIQIAPLSSSGN
jgi:hypothetical protein